MLGAWAAPGTFSGPVRIERGVRTVGRIVCRRIHERTTFARRRRCLPCRRTAPGALLRLAEAFSHEDGERRHGLPRVCAFGTDVQLRAFFPAQLEYLQDALGVSGLPG